MSQYVYKPSVTTSSGSWTGDTMKIVPGICFQVYVKASSENTIFDIKIEDAYNFEVQKIIDITGMVNDLTKFPVDGVLTVTIENATADEAFTLKIVVEEF
jgi:hypothetical protein